VQTECRRTLLKNVGKPPTIRELDRVRFLDDDLRCLPLDTQYRVSYDRLSAVGRVE
jgi:hypothetical protein